MSSARKVTGSKHAPSRFLEPTCPPNIQWLPPQHTMVAWCGVKLGERVAKKEASQPTSQCCGLGPYFSTKVIMALALRIALNVALDGQQIIPYGIDNCIKYHSTATQIAVMHNNTFSFTFLDSTKVSRQAILLQCPS